MRNFWFQCALLFLISSQIVFCTGAESTSHDDFKFDSAEKRLIKKLLRKYEEIGKIGRPVENVSQTLTVHFGLSLFQLVHLDEKNQMLILNVWNKFSWKDEILVWDPEEYNGITHVRIPIKHIWTPDIKLYNDVDLRIEWFRKVLSTVDYTGMVFWSPPAIYKSRCRIDMRYFPFDQQVCFLRFSSATLDSDRMTLNFFGSLPEVSLEDYSASNEWQILKKPAIKRMFNQSCCKAPFTNMIFFLVLQRNPAYYAYLLVLPCVLLAFLNLVTFWLPPQQPARMMLGMNIIMSFCILMKFLTASTPSASESIPYLGYYCCLNMVLISLSCFISAYIVNLHFRRHKAKLVPAWLAKATRVCSPFLCLVPGCRRSQTDTNENANVNKYELQAFKKKCLYPYPNQANNFNICGNCQGYFSCPCAYSGDCHVGPAVSWVCPRVHRAPSNHYLTDIPQSCTPERQPADGSMSAQLERNLSEIKKALRNLMNKVGDKDQSAKLASEWTQVALAIDRFCFCVYLVVISVTALGLLLPINIIYSDEDIIANFDKEFGQTRY